MAGTMDYNSCEQYILNIPKFAGKNTTRDTYEILKKLIDVKKLPPVIHVAGTNGKGSVCTYLKGILNEAGYSVGMFTSPHLVFLRERMEIDGIPVSKEDFLSCFNRVKENISDSGHPSFFEYLFLMALCYFYEKKPDYIILETGLGGRLDATNCFDEKVLTVITEIGFDHMQYLGDTIGKIAYEKAGIARKNVPLVVCAKRDEALKVIRNYYTELGGDCSLNFKTVDTSFYKNVNVSPEMNELTFDYVNGDIRIDGVKLKGTALYQCENASLAITGAFALQDLRITMNAVKNGIRKAFWPGRMEKVSEHLIIDGAHNEDGIAAFVNSVRAIRADSEALGRDKLLFGVMSDKAYETIIQMTAESGLFSDVALIHIDTDRSLELSKNKEVWSRYPSIKVECFNSTAEGLDYLKRIRENREMIFAAGSLYMIGEILSLQK